MKVGLGGGGREEQGVYWTKVYLTVLDYRVESDLFWSSQSGPLVAAEVAMDVADRRLKGRLFERRHPDVHRRDSARPDPVLDTLLRA